MATHDIPLFHLEKNPFEMGILSLSDQTTLELVNEKVRIPHRHDHYCFFFMESGCLNFSVDFQNIDIQPSSLLITRPGQIHELGFAKDPAGWLLAFDAHFIDEKARSVIDQSFVKVILLQLDEAEKTEVCTLFNLIYSTECEKSPANFHQRLLQTLINALFYKIVLIFQAQEDKRIQSYSSRSMEITRRFHQLVKAHFLLLKKTADYASKLNITVSYLNDTVKAVTGFSSTYLIQLEIFREAQRFLVYTTNSVKEIAFQLGYDDEKYFIRLFSKTIGTSPASFRKKYR
ncbi:helix-turn-helix domain-containing protein [Larkinella humicola]|uniref:Helix-turn-helix domain-containing protein n=2 Tax=Larkinella humicola TaxID=2607654 RepID=A0A5N1JNT5_9BACT|nr:helix-turn-helix domain-containing protein [Larkinella humicola]